MPAMRPFKPDPKRKTWQLEFRDHRGNLRRLSSRAKSRATALAIGNRIEQLLDYRMRGDPVPENLTQWAYACHPAIRAKLLEWEIIDTRTVQGAEPLDAHVEAWRQSLIDEECTERYVSQTVERVRRVFRECQMEYYCDIDADAILATLRRWRRAGLSPRTCNFMLAKVKQFCSWAKRARRALSDPLAGVKLYDGKVVNADIRHERRALTIEEQRHLLAVTAKEPNRWRMTGPERSLLYRFVIGTALRAKEVRSLMAGAFDLKAKPATVTVKAGDSKHRQEDVQPIPGGLVPLLQEHLQSKLPDAPAWPQLHESGYGKMLKDDLRAAEIPYQDASGRYADFHALRHSAITNWARVEPNVKAVQVLARHADIRTTYRHYAHILLTEQAATLAKVPSLDAEADREAKRDVS